MSQPIRQDIIEELWEALKPWAAKHLKDDCWYAVGFEIKRDASNIWLSDAHVTQDTGDGSGEVLAAT